MLVKVASSEGSELDDAMVAATRVLYIDKRASVGGFGVSVAGKCVVVIIGMATGARLKITWVLIRKW
jgi:hypothetical protein